ncbi:hypothetical protein PHMEG_0009931 [Phytophthora megakarya]|uniref:MULE transposase domain-containing protein n=1 Tax=Phytophthora megakarya TaxID=4795 RepID=A0A225WHE0_9STRA|nr:hypothetical protein PHMEG_0009931 [Phytophthora megakarya]
MDTGYASDESMSRHYADSDLSDAPPDVSNKNHFATPGLKFFQFQVTYYEYEVQHRLIGWAHPHLMDRMKQRRSSIFVDATYRLYDRLFHNVFVGAKKKLDPAHIVCDFEFALIKSVQEQFPESRIVGCLFHFKQALRRKMFKLKITDLEVELAMREGCIDRLTIVRRMDVPLQGVHDVRFLIKRDCRARCIGYSRDNWKKFWKYFKNIWIHKFKPEWWNINGIHEDIVNRTNNPLERYNRILNSAFSGAHPDITRFISVIEEQSREKCTSFR